MGKEGLTEPSSDHAAKLAFKKSQILAKRQKKKLFHSINPLLVSKKERLVQKVIAKKQVSQTAPPPGGDANLLMRESSSKLQKIKKQTLFLVQLDKYAVRDAVEGLRAYYEQMTEDREHSGRRDDIVEVVITISKVLAKVTLKPIKVAVVHPLHTPEQKGLTGLIHRDNNKKIESLKEFFSTNRIQVG